jgi:hypothetical protein
MATEYDSTELVNLLYFITAPRNLRESLYTFLSDACELSFKYLILLSYFRINPCEANYPINQQKTLQANPANNQLLLPTNKRFHPFSIFNFNPTDSSNPGGR